ncbi:hypothetical protein LJC05_03270, partial [Bacteroides sp. OttesenSCG-928-J23]|nr:hypothetical protein [Bacteroides sp. OttesenSCG-928-J23]
MKLKSYIYLLVASVVVLFSACTPDKHELGAKDLTVDDLVEGIAFTITHDANNPNIVYLESKLDASYKPLWEHPQGRSQDQKVTLRIPFGGTYEVTFGVETRGGIVYGEPTTFEIDDFYAGFVDNQLWTLLSGGVDNSKSWVLDLDNEGVSRFFVGPIYFFTLGYNWNNLHAPNGNNYLDTEGWDAATAISPSTDWFWTADWPGNPWICDKADFGTMTFNLIGGANVTTDQEEYGLGVLNGSYMLDTENYTLTFTDAWPVHDSNRDGHYTSRVFKILYMSENAMQLAIELDNDGSLICYNYISTDYRDNWAPPVNDNVTPELPEDWRDYVEPKTNLVVTYKLSEDTPFDWCNFNGSLKGIEGFSAKEGIEDITLVLNSGTKEYTLTDIDGNEYTGKYTLGDDGIYTFSDALPEIALSTDGRAVFKTNADRTLRIMSYERSDFTGAVTDLWIGSKEMDDQGNLYQYMGYHFVVQSAGGTVKSYKTTLSFFDDASPEWNFIHSDPLFISTDGNYTLVVEGANSSPYGLYLDIEKILKDNPNMDVEIKEIKVDGTSIAFDDLIIDRGTGDVATTARRYIL